jgi:diguanylate cyclase
VRYVETVARSAELLRQAIPLMSQQAAALHPVSYAVWYEYVAKSNPPLLKMVDDSLTRFGRLDEAKTHAIFRQYISEPLVRLPERVADGFERLLSDISDSANRAGAQTERYSHALEHLRGSLPVAAGGPVA